MKRWLLAIGLTASLSMGCSKKCICDAVPPGPASVALFTLDATPPPFLAVPFPSDLYLDASGRIADLPGLAAFLPQGADHFTAALTGQHGFSRTAAAMFAIDDTTAAEPARLDPTSLPQAEADSLKPTAGAFLVDLDATDRMSAIVPSRSHYSDDRDLGAPLPPVLVVYPARGVVLPQAHHVAAVLTTQVRDQSGAAIGPSPELSAIVAGQRNTDAEKLYGKAIDRVLALTGMDPAQLAGIAAYTTHDAHDELIALRAQIAKAPAPKLSWKAADLAPVGLALFGANQALVDSGFTATLDAWLGKPAKLPDGSDDPADDSMTGRAHDALAAIGTAVFQAPNFLQIQPNGYDDPAHGTFARDASGKIVANASEPTEKIWATFALPSSPMPMSGFPVVIIQHGLGGGRQQLLAWADTFAKQGWASVAIESTTFGARASELDPTFAVADKTAGFAWSSAPGGYNGPDGFADDLNNEYDFFGVLKDLGAPRDQMRQSVIDLGSLVELLRDPSLDFGPLLLAVPGAKLDPTRIAYVGNSLGGIMGAMLAACDPHVRHFVLNVAGAGLLTEIPDAPFLGSLLPTAASAFYGVKKGRFSPNHPLLQLLQHAVDAGDPLIYAGDIVTAPVSVAGAQNPPKDVIQIEALFDEVVSNESNEALARAAGFPLAEPNVGSHANVPLGAAKPQNGAISGVPVMGATAVLVQAGPATHGADLTSAHGQHSYQVPWGNFDSATPFVKLMTPLPVDEPYLALQKMMTGFFASAFAGGAPTVSGVPTPTLDFSKK